jgi:hypothetical protein
MTTHATLTITRMCQCSFVLRFQLCDVLRHRLACGLQPHDRAVRLAIRSRDGAWHRDSGELVRQLGHLRIFGRQELMKCLNRSLHSSYLIR